MILNTDLRPIWKKSTFRIFWNPSLKGCVLYYPLVPTVFGATRSRDMTNFEASGWWCHHDSWHWFSGGKVMCRYAWNEKDRSCLHPSLYPCKQKRETEHITPVITKTSTCILPCTSTWTCTCTFPCACACSLTLLQLILHMHLDFHIPKSNIIEHKSYGWPSQI